MGRACKCKITKESLNTDTAFCVVNNGKKEYYKSEELYNAEVTDKIKFTNAMRKILNVKNNIKMPVQYNTVLKRWHTEEKIPYKVISLSAYLKRKEITNVINNKQFSNFNYKLMYVMKIIENGFQDGYDLYDKDKRQKNKTDNTDLDLLNESLKEFETKPKSSIADFI